jgi:glycine cleavage system H protein
VSEADYPDTLKYHRDHDWALVDGDTATFGITWYAQDALGDVVFFAPPEVGAQVSAGNSYGELESVKAVSDLIAPLDCEILEINSEIVETPEKVNDGPYDAWLVKARLTDTSQLDSLLDAEAYRALVDG